MGTSTNFWSSVMRRALQYDGERWRSYIKTEWGDWLEVTTLSTCDEEPKKCPRCGGHKMGAKEEEEGSLTCGKCGFEITASSLEAAVSLWNAI